MKGRKGIYVPSFFRLKIGEEDSMTFLLVKRNKKMMARIKNIWALSWEGERILIHSNMDLNIQGIMLYYNQTKI
ncbi:hypothetical protein B8W99_18535 [Peribacillus simplex]|nr:hypothetical protein B8W99_18535 [Peribacillus simplex]